MRAFCVTLALCTAGLCGAQPTRNNNVIALAEMQSIANAMDACALDTTYYVAPETLNDTTIATTPPTIARKASACRGERTQSATWSHRSPALR